MVLPASKARSNFYTILEEVSKKLKRFVITVHGQPQAVVISPEEVESWEETLEIQTNKKLVRDIQKAEKERLTGKGIPEKILLKELSISAKNLRKM